MKDYFNRFMGIDIEYKDSEGNTLMNFCALKSFPEGVAFLINLGANVNT